MSSSIKEFLSKEKPEGYYKKLVNELSEANKQLGAFLNINETIKNGFPFSAKDNLCVRDVETKAGSEILAGYIPPFNATCVERLSNNKFSFLGKTSMDEFGFGSFGLNTTCVAKNPFDTAYVAGGSSSGAAVATSILKYHAALAESTGGSISNPAAFCGVVGFTPTYGAISRYGLVDYANSLDKIGIMARSAEDVRTVFDIVKGPDSYDSTCVDMKFTNINNKKIFLIKQLLDATDEKVRSEFDKLVSKIREMGYSVEEKSLEFIEKAIPAYYIISMAEASTNLAKYNGYKYGFKNENFSEEYNRFFTESRSKFGVEAKRRVVLGTFVRSASVKEKYYRKALKVRSLLIREIGELLKNGFILTPTMPITTPKIEKAVSLTPVESYRMDVLTIPPSICGFPHVSFPYSYPNGMPLGAQIISNHFNDYALLDFVNSWETSFRYKFKYNIGDIR